ncbi:hypothetical protein AAF712_013469 [Marasmius tenuissimus]|uniref:F-box domain-containing protein n=1 Tax=Marasmius tenuissimus TaxID=585030 RepID=A0ABR2ZEW3_9AGAR
MASTNDSVGYMEHFARYWFHSRGLMRLELKEAARSTRAVLEIHKQLADNREQLQILLRHTTPTPQSQDCTPLGRFENHVSQIDTELVKLKDAISSITQYVEAGRSLLAPIRKLPAEVLQQIFQICCEDGIDIDVKGGQHATPMPVVLSCVCTLWRGLTVSLPTLWSALRYKIHIESIEEAGQCLRITELFLQRARNAPLTLSFDAFPWVGPENMAHMDPSLNALCRRAEQWISVSFSIPSILLQHSAFYTLKGRLQNLHTIQFIELQRNVLDEYLSMLDFFGDCPALRAADFDLWTNRPVDRLPEIPWSQLTSVRLKSASRTPRPHPSSLCATISRI